MFASTFSRTWVPVRTKVGYRRAGVPRPAALLRDATDPRGRGRQGGAAGALGHSTPTITLNEYVHEWPDALDRTRSLVDSALGGPETAATPAVSQA